MHFCKNILKHLALMQEMGKAHMPDSLLKDYKEEKLLEISQSINQMDAGGLVAALDKKAVEYLIRDQGFLPYLMRLAQEESYDALRVSRLLIEAKDVPLSESYPYEQIASVLADGQIEAGRTYTCLKYFMSEPLTEEEKDDLMVGLSVLDGCAGFSIDDLTDKERRLLAEPVISSGFLGKMVQERGFIKRLICPGYGALIKRLSENAGRRVCLGKKQEKELWDHAEVISAGLGEVLKRIPSEETGNFLKQWFDNGALVYDLNRLKHLLSEMPPDQELTFMKNRISYLNFLYGNILEGVDMMQLSGEQNSLLVYGITHKKKHFLSVVKENFRDFTYFGWRNLLLDKDTYEQFLNINTLNSKNMKDCARLNALSDEKKQVLTWEEYTFEEIRLFATADIGYVKLYHCLAGLKIDDRLRAIRELTGRNCLPENLPEEQMGKLGMMLKEKPVSRWLAAELGHVEQISYEQAVRLLSVWDEVCRFIPEIQTGHHADFLLYSLKELHNLPDFRTAMERMPEIDESWMRLNEVLRIDESFLHKNREGLMRFLCNGGAEIFRAFLSGDLEAKKEKTRRLCVAEIAGRFREVKYYKDDLEREIALQVPEDVQQLWIKNMEMKKKRMRLWEEDRLLPVMQIGEVIGHTCLSYRDGGYKRCLLSCFDANKKVLYLSLDGTLAFRAIIRLTKGAFCRMPGKHWGLQFADLTREETDVKTEDRRKEYLTLFLERPYFKRISEDKEKEAVCLAVEMLKKKAKQLKAELVLSDSYKKYALEGKEFIRAKYYMYISASKNGEQYLDSLGGMAGASEEGSYEEGYFLLPESFVNPEAGKDKQEDING